jgi:hypothetical protein
LHPALVAQQFVPFIDDDHLHATQNIFCIGAREQQRQAFRRGDQHGRQTLVLCGTLSGCGVSASRAGGPGSEKRRALVAAQPVQDFQGLLQCAQRVGCECPHRRDPQHGQGLRRDFSSASNICY